MGRPEGEGRVGGREEGWRGRCQPAGSWDSPSPREATARGLPRALSAPAALPSLPPSQSQPQACPRPPVITPWAASRILFLLFLQAEKQKNPS